MFLVANLIDFYSLLIIAAVVLSWFQADRRQPLVAFIYRLTEPVLAPVRNALPPMGGLDLSPMVVLIVLQLLKGVIA